MIVCITVQNLPVTFLTQDPLPSSESREIPAIGAPSTDVSSRALRDGGNNDPSTKSGILVDELLSELARARLKSVLERPEPWVQTPQVLGRLMRSFLLASSRVVRESGQSNPDCPE